MGVASFFKKKLIEGKITTLNKFVSTILTVKTRTLWERGWILKVELVKRCMMINFGYKLKQIVATNLVDIYFPKQIAVPTFGGF